MRSILKYRSTVDRANDELQYKRWTAQGLTPNNWKLNVCSCFNVNINKFLVVSNFNCITVTCIKRASIRVHHSCISNVMIYHSIQNQQNDMHTNSILHL